jgi:FlaA1/EpsC-like NDP-sugar epimerase
MEVAGPRIGEKDHETLINHHEIRLTYELPFGYVITQADTEVEPNTRKVTSVASYSSDTVERHTVKELADILRKEGLAPS